MQLTVHLNRDSVHTGDDLESHASTIDCDSERINRVRVRFRKTYSDPIYPWDNVMKQLTQTDAWKKELADNNWDNEYRNAAETRKYMDADYAELKGFLTELELVKGK